MSISNELKNAVTSFLAPLLKKMHHHDVWVYGDHIVWNTLEVKAQQTKEKVSETLILNLEILHHDKQLHLHNIFIPTVERNKGYGFGLINEIRTVARENGYELFIVDMVPTFYQRMIAKGATPVNEVDDAVLVDEETDLLSHRS
jgi:predicted N-acetyltransferase YhbS